MNDLKRSAINILFRQFPPDKYDPVSIHDCADEWCSKQVTTNGIVNYYKAYFSGKNVKKV
jgi:hypothetical protein|tara:strand:+ start:107 stop:286 length:180 start_codon:yes stop_codon:yes gene_type:complete